MASVTDLWRHPIKSHGREALSQVRLTAGNCLPWDRHWAVAHGRSKFDGVNWASCRNFMIGALTPELAGIWANLDEATGNITMRHQDLGAVTFDPDTEQARFLDWVAPLCPRDRDTPTEIIKVEGRGMTDSDYPSVSIMTQASHRDVESALGQSLAPERWRGNIWLDGVTPWAELDWIDKTIRIGSAEVSVREPIKRCKHTQANPVTGKRDVDTLDALNNTFGHQNFGVYAVVTQSGSVSVGDQAQVL